MKSLKKKRRIQVILLTFVALVISTGMIGYAMRDGINFFRSPSQVAEMPPPPTEVFRIGGMVEEGSLVRGQGAEIKFRVTDFNASIEVIYNGVPPDLFGEGEGMVGTGSLVDGVFVVKPNGLLARHDESYMPAEVTEALEASGYKPPDG